MSKGKMLKFYWAILGYICIAWNHPNEQEKLHEELKVWYGITTTKKMDADLFYKYLEFVIELASYCFDIGFDTDLYKNYWIICIYNCEGKLYLF